MIAAGSWQCRLTVSPPLRSILPQFQRAGRPPEFGVLSPPQTIARGHPAEHQRIHTRLGDPRRGCQAVAVEGRALSPDLLVVVCR
jgi:hypothetical protein